MKHTIKTAAKCKCCGKSGKGFVFYWHPEIDGWKCTNCHVEQGGAK